jgi:hypothetical protein
LSFVNYYIGWVFVISVSASSTSQPIDELELLDWGTRIGVAGRCERIIIGEGPRRRQKEMSKSQFENLITLLDATTGREALLATAAYALRQAQRQEIGRITAMLIKQALMDLYEKGIDKKFVRKMLDFAKWVYEAIEDYKRYRNVIDNYRRIFDNDRLSDQDKIQQLNQLTLYQFLKQLRQQRTG